MRVLVLGGTGFVGRHLVSACLEAGHAVTMVNRGRSDPGAFPGVETLVGDRDAGLDGVLDGRSWDAVFDTCGYVPGPVRASARATRGARYAFVSSISVYPDLAHTNESRETRSHEGLEDAPLSPEHYGALKAACETALAGEVEASSLFIVRAGLIVGPHDYDARFRYWLTRVAQGGGVLAPGDPGAFAQCIDARDLAAWMLACVEQGVAGTFNATGPREPLTMRALLETVRDVVGGDARFVWAPDELLLAHEVRPYSEMPFWLPASMGARPIDIAKALDAGLVHRPFVETVRDTWSWMREGWDRAASVRENRALRPPAGLAAERERAVLEALAR